MDYAPLAALIAVLFTVCVVRQANGADCARKYDPFPGHTACISSSPDATPLQLSSQDKTDVLNKHNTLRGGVSPVATNMMKMTWDDEVAMLAQKWADSCPIDNGNLQHDKNEERLVPGRFSVGQNLAYGYATFEAAIQAWYDEVSDYNYGTAKSAHTEVVGHYTQVVWAESVKLGCGRARCDGNVIHVCNYAPAGNVGDFIGPYETGASRASDCQTASSGLCDCGDLVCLNRKPLNPGTCSCDCGSRYNTPDCSLNCAAGDASYCGTGGFVKSNCITGLAAQISSDCPNQCEICPYAEKGYAETTTPTATTKTTAPTPPDTTATTKSTSTNPSGGVDTTATTTTTTDNEGDNEDDDDGASMLHVCLSLIVLASFVSIMLQLGI